MCNLHSVSNSVVIFPIHWWILKYNLSPGISAHSFEGNIRKWIYVSKMWLINLEMVWSLVSMDIKSTKASNISMNRDTRFIDTYIFWFFCTYYTTFFAYPILAIMSMFSTDNKLEFKELNFFMKRLLTYLVTLSNSRII